MAILSCDNGITFGVTGDFDAAPDIDVLVHGIATAVADLLEASENLVA